MGEMRIRGLKAGVRCECSISRRGPHRAVEESEEEVTVLVGMGSPKKQGRSRESSSRSESCQEF